ncbi:MAG: terpene cyclase/mutase family protein [Bacteroidetes bacterium]|nr:terpene cyclase/mutase family protein [Bacteroidota bacterium]
MNSHKLLETINANIDNLTICLKNHQIEDGGFKGYHLFDQSSGIWTTCEILHILLKSNHKLCDKDWILKSVNYLTVNQNNDGGWGFRTKGKSIIDITAWACLALNHFNSKDSILKGVEFILKARLNTGGIDKGGWGLTTFEPDRIYSTGIAVNCLTQILTSHEEWFQIEEKNKILNAINEAHNWILNSKNQDGGWGSGGDNNSTLVSSSIALISLFSQGEDPKLYKDSFEFLAKHSTRNLWELEREIVITQEGYELTQEWFTSVYCFRAYIFFAEFGLCSLDRLHSTFVSLLSLIDNGKVKPTTEGTLDLIWPIPLMIECLDKFKSFVSSKKKEYDDFLYQKELEEKKRKKIEMEGYLKNLFPYPISQAYFSFMHEIDNHRRFQYLLQLNEVILKYAAVVSLSSVIASNEKLPALKNAIEGKFRKPSLGDFVSVIDIILNNSGKIENTIYPWTKDELIKRQPNFIDNEAPRMNLNQTFSEIVSLRNTWSGHGAIRSLYEYKMEIEKQIPFLFSFLNRFMFLAKCNSFLILSSDFNEFGDGDIYKIRLFNGLDILDNDLEIQKRLSEGQREQLIRYVYFHNTESNTIVNLYPFLSHMYCTECKKERFFFFNGVKSNNKITYLSFECGHTIDYDNLTHFIKRFEAVNIQF